MNYKALIFDNKLYFYSISEAKLEKISIYDICSDDKILDINKFELILNGNSFFKKLRNKLISSKGLFYYWENYNNDDLLLLKNLFSLYNISLEFKLVDDLMDKNSLVFSHDGIHVISNHLLYYGYRLYTNSIENTYDSICHNLNVSNPILVGNVKINDGLYYENNDTFFEDLIKA